MDAEPPVTDTPDTPESQPHVTSGPMVTLALLPDAVRAHLLVSLLDSRGVEARVFGEHTPGLGAYAGNASSTVTVRLEDYLRAVDELKAFMLEREADDKAGGIPARKAAGGACPVCGYDMRGLGDNTRCPECGVDQDALARLRQWVQIAPPPRQLGGADPVGHAFEITGITLGLIVLGLAAVGIVILIVLAFRK